MNRPQFSLGRARTLATQHGGCAPCPTVMTEEELILYLRIPEISHATNHHQVIENLKRNRGLPRIHLCGKTVYLINSVRRWHTKYPKAEGNPYVFVPMARYEHIQGLRRAGRWSVERGRSLLVKLCHHFNKIRKRAGIETGTFHDLRRTCLSNWVGQGLSLHEVKELAGHTKIETTERFYLAVRKDVLDRARTASEASRKGYSVARLLRAPVNRTKTRKCRAQVLCRQRP